MARDAHGRRIDYLRISVTDRCNLRCTYCMPEEGVEWKPVADILTYEEIERFAAAAVSLGITKIRLTGGEPLVRKGLADHIRRLKHLTGLEAIALTTNGTLLEQNVASLREAGLSRINVSLDSLDPEVYSAITRGGDLDDALAGLSAALDEGFSPVKVNVVVVRSLNQDLGAFADMAIDRPLHVRFIEYMPVGDAAPEGGRGHGGCWTEEDHVPAEEILGDLVSATTARGMGELEEMPRSAGPEGWGPARYFTVAGAKGTLGVISPLSRHVCGHCNRLRLTADGRLRPCLFSDGELDVREALRGGTDEDVAAVILAALESKPKEHEQRRGTDRRMSQIGG